MSRLVEKNREEGADDMYDTARRVALVKKRVRDNTRRRQRRSVYGLSAACMLLFAALVQVEGMAIERGQTAAQGTFGAMLLREDGTLSTTPATESADPTDRQTPYCYFVTYGSRHTTHPASLRLKSLTFVNRTPNGVARALRI